MHFNRRMPGLPEPLAFLVGEDLARRDYRGRMRRRVLGFLEALAGQRVVEFFVCEYAHRDPVGRLLASARVDRAVADIAPSLDAVAHLPLDVLHIVVLADAQFVPPVATEIRK